MSSVLDASAHSKFLLKHYFLVFFQAAVAAQSILLNEVREITPPAPAAQVGLVQILSSSS